MPRSGDVAGDARTADGAVTASVKAMTQPPPTRGPAPLTSAWHAGCCGPGVRFNLVVIDPPSYPYTHFLFDTVRMLAASLEELGFDTSIRQNKLEADALNVLVGIHLLSGGKDVDDILDTGHRFIVLQTEMIKGRTVNREDNDRVDRVVLPLCRAAVAVWDSSPENIAALATMGVRAGLLRFGHVGRLRELPPKATRDIDFFWYGSITESRRVILAELTRLGYRVEVCFDTPALFRNDLIARSEIVLTLAQGPNMQHVPHARIIYLVSNRVLVAGQGGENQAALEDTYLWHNGPDIVEFLRVARARRDREELRGVFWERLSKRPMREFVAPLVEQLTQGAS